MINANGGWDNWDMIILEKCCLKNVEEAKLREHYWYDKLRPTLNMNTPLLFGLTKDEVKDECKKRNCGIEQFKYEKLKEEIDKRQKENQMLKNLLTENNIIYKLKNG